MKEYAKSINLKDDPDLIAKYLEYHDNIWPEVVESFKAVGVIDIKIFKIGRQLFMYMVTEDHFDPEKDFERYLQMNPKNPEWEDLMATFQEPLPGAKEGEHWAALEKIFELNKE
ncbi:L-rhamnose mutarotase [Rapidithrix thailandica]|uniref:L-rhamnose mutarotase n=1 Tax=Rapidithrix thailandica TaxID=413964 RepID=A0AAW9SDR2_9BACT